GDYVATVPFWLDLADGHYEFPAPDRDGHEPVIFVDSLEKMHAIAAAMQIRRLGRDEPERCGQFLLRMLSDEAPRLRRSAAMALGMLAADNPRSREALETIKVRDALAKLKGDVDESIRDAAQRALGGFRK